MKLHPNADVVGVIDPLGDVSLVGEDVDRTRRYEFASVTKILTTLVIADAIADGFAKFDDAIYDPYFTKGFVTLADLLSHASGMRPDGQDCVAPRTKRIYTNEAYELAEKFLINCLGEGFEASNIASLFADGVGAQLRSSMVIEGSCASGAVGTFDDLMLVLGEIRSPQILDSAMHSLLTSIYLPELEGIVPGFGNFEKNTWGIGCEIRGNKSHWMGSLSSPDTYGHFGQSGAFVMHDPVNNISVATLSNTSFGPWAKEWWPQLMDEIYTTYL